MPSITEVYAADLGSNHYAVDLRDQTTSTTLLGYVATFNTPTDSFNTIVMPKVIGGETGDVIKVSVFKGSIPDDPNDPNDDGEVDAKINESDLVEVSSYTVTETIPSTGINVQFDFSTIFTRTLLGDTYTVVVEQCNSSGAYVAFSPVFCTDRDGVYNYVNDDDAGHQEGSGAFAQGGPNDDGGAGNVYTLNTYVLNLLPAFDKYDIFLTVGEWTIDGTVTKDPCPAWGIYNRINGIYTALGTTRSVSRTIKNEATRSVVRPVNA